MSNNMSLNPLKIREGFEHLTPRPLPLKCGLNPLKIREGFEHLEVSGDKLLNGVLIP